MPRRTVSMALFIPLLLLLLAWHPAEAAMPSAATMRSGPSGLISEPVPTLSDTGIEAAISRDGRARVTDLLRRLNETADAELRRSLSRQVVEAKRDADVEILRFRATVARGRGDEASAVRFEATIAMLLKPAVQVPVSGSVKGSAAAGEIAALSSSTGEPPVVSAVARLAPVPLRDGGALVTQDAPDLTAASGNLDATVTFPGWYAPIVARSDATATMSNCVPTPTLNNETPDTHIIWGWVQTGFGLPAYTSEAYVDDVLAGTAYINDSAPIGNHAVLNLVPLEVRGGRHTVSSVLDPANTVPETNESDNRYAVQYIWNPYPLSSGVPVVRATPPAVGIFSYPHGNADGFAFVRPSLSYAWVVSLAARSPGDDDDLLLFDDYTGSTAGFNNLVSSSRSGSNYTDFVAGHYSGTPATLYPAASLYANPVGQPFVIDQIDAANRNSVANANTFWFDEMLDANRLANVYETYMTVGDSWYFVLHRLYGPTTPLIEVFSGTSGQLHARGTGSSSVPVAGSNDWSVLGPYHATETGWHPVVVYRNTGTDSDQPVSYDFNCNMGGLLGIPSSTAEQTAAFLGVTPNPVVDQGRFEFVLPAPGRATLALFDVGGRCVRSIADGVFDAGRQSVRWNGRDDSGARLGSGVYWARLEVAGHTFTRTLALMQ